MAIPVPRSPQTCLDDLACVIEAEFSEMPGLRLTFAQVRRLWNLSSEDCEHVLDYLVGAGRLVQSGDGRFFRPHDEPLGV